MACVVTVVALAGVVEAEAEVAATAPKPASSAVAPAVAVSLMNRLLMVVLLLCKAPATCGHSSSLCNIGAARERSAPFRLTTPHRTDSHPRTAQRIRGHRGRR